MGHFKMHQQANNLLYFAKFGGLTEKKQRTGIQKVGLEWQKACMSNRVTGGDKQDWREGWEKGKIKIKMPMG